MVAQVGDKRINEVAKTVIKKKKKKITETERKAVNKISLPG